MATEKIHQWKTQTTNPGATLALAEVLGQLLEPGDVVALTGELGSGKTLFAQGLARGLQVPESYYITSPTFVILNEYPGRIPFYHLDLYRLTATEELAALGLEEVLYGAGAVAVEWPEKLGEELPEDRVEIQLAITGENSRDLTFLATGPRSLERLTALAGCIQDRAGAWLFR